MHKLLTILFFFITIKISVAQSLYFPPTDEDTWDILSPSYLGWCEDKVDSLYNYLETKNSKAFILLKDGKIVLEKYFGLFTQDSLWYWASAGKTLTAFTVGIAQQEGYLSIEDTTSKYLGEGWTGCPPEKEDLITICHQLTMTTGLDDGVPDHYCTLDTCLQYKADAGTRWAYHNGPYTKLDEVITNATGKTLNQYFRNKIRNPIGMDGAFIPVGYNNVYASTARSMARFGLLILNKGNWDGQQIMTDNEYYTQMVNKSQELNLSYGYLWWLNGKNSYMMPGLQYVFNGSINPDAPSDMFAALGKNGQLINVVPSQKLVFIRMGNSPGSSEIASTLNNEIWTYLNDVMCNVSKTSVQKNGFDPVMYPNPTKGYITIKLLDNYFDVSLMELSGQKIFGIQNCYGQISVNISECITGIYFVEVKSKGFIKRDKLIISQN